LRMSFYTGHLQRPIREEAHCCLLRLRSERPALTSP